MMNAVVCLFKTAEEPLEWLIPEFRHLCSIQFRNDENEISVYHAFVISMQHSLSSNVKVRNKDYN